MTCKMMHQICYGFYWSIKKWSIFGSFCEFFNLRALTPENYTPRFCQMEDLIKLYICGTFHQYSICGCEIKNFQSLLHWFSIHEIDPFCFLAHISHISFDLAESLSRGSQIRQTHCLRILQNFEIWLKWNTLKVYGFGSFWGPTYCRKTKDFAKTQKFWKTASFRI